MPQVLGPDPARKGGVRVFRTGPDGVSASSSKDRTVERVPPVLAARPRELLYRVMVALGLLVALVEVALYLVDGQGIVVLLACVPAAIVLPLLLLLDRVEPESPGTRWVSLAWGFGAAGLAAGLANTFVAAFGVASGVSSDIAFLFVAVVCAPVVEETLKAIPLFRGIRTGLVSSPIDAVIFAGWSAVGFTVVENVLYLSDAYETGMLAPVFALRCLASPFAHTLFTSATALGLSAAVRHGVKAYGYLGILAAVALHASWNATASLDMALFVLTYLAQGALLVGVVVWLVRVRNRERDTVMMLAATFPLDGVLVHARRGYDQRRSLLFATLLALDLARRQPTAYHAERARLLCEHFVSTTDLTYLPPPSPVTVVALAAPWPPPLTPPVSTAPPAPATAAQWSPPDPRSLQS